MLILEDIRRLVIKSFHIQSVSLSDKTEIKGSNLSLSVGNTIAQLVNREKLVEKIDVNVIKPGEHYVEINTIMDIIPISTKVLGRCGEGITHTLTGVYVLLTGCDADGRQMHEFGSSEGILSEQIAYGKAGTPTENDFLIHIDVTLVGGMPYERAMPLAAFRSSDKIIQIIRTELKQLEGNRADEVHEYYDRKATGKKRIVIVKQIAGQGAMYDNLLFSDEPSGFNGGVSNIDMLNMPVVLSPNEYRDGVLRSMT